MGLDTGMTFRERSPIWWKRLVTSGLALQLAAIIVGVAAWQNQSCDSFGDCGIAQHSTGGLIVASVIGWGGLWSTVIGLVMLGVTAAIDPISLRTEEHRPRIAPAQDEPSQLAGDPVPFEPHAGDSAIVASVRHWLLLGSSRSAVNKRVSKAARKTAIDTGDQALIDALLVERDRRPLAPSRPSSSASHNAKPSVSHRSRAKNGALN